MTRKHRKESLDAFFRKRVLLGMLGVAGADMWAYGTETGKLRHIGFADTVHRYGELQYVDPLGYLELMNGEDAQIITQSMIALHAGRPPQEGIHYRVHGNGGDFYLEDHVVTCQPLGNGFYYLKGYARNITAQIMEMSRLCIGKERTEQTDRLRLALFSHVSRELRGPPRVMGKLVSRMMNAGSREEREECSRQIQENEWAAMEMADALHTVSQLPASTYEPYHPPMRLCLMYRDLLTENGCIHNSKDGEQEVSFLSLPFSQ